MEIQRIVNEPMPSNCYVVVEQNHTIVIDPGTIGSRELIKSIHNQNLIVDYIILTHEHFDHCAGCNALRNSTKAQLICSELCNECVQDDRRNYSAYWAEGKPFKIGPAEKRVKDQEEMEWQGHCFHFYMAPGHTSASIAVQIDEEALFTGDDFIPHVRTYTNLKTGSKEELISTLALFSSFYKFEKMKIYPGHYEPMLIRDVHFNQAIRGLSQTQLSSIIR
jgi:hydroxyacylglutathione hydrolase